VLLFDRHLLESIFTVSENHDIGHTDTLCTTTSIASSLDSCTTIALRVVAVP
jgi:hypothetical protein